MNNDEHVKSELMSVIPVRGVTNLEFKGAKMFIEGYAYLDGLEELDPHKIKIDLLVKSDELEVELLSDKSKDSTDVSSSYPNKEHVFSTTKNYSADDIKELKNSNNKKAFIQNSSYKATIDFNKIDDGEPLETGNYQLYIRLNQFINNIWKSFDFTVGTLDNFNKDFIYTTNIKIHQTKKVTTYYFGVQYLNVDNNLYITSNKLSTVNPDDLMVEDNTIKNESKLVRRFKKLIFRIAYPMFKILPINYNSIAFISDSRSDLTGNFEYIYREIKRRSNTVLKSRFYFKRTNKEPKTLLEYLSLAKAIATSQYVLLDDFYPLIYPLKIRKNIELVQVWHAVGSFKTFGFSRLGMEGGPSIKSKNHRNYKHAIVSSKNVIQDYAEGFGISKNKIIPIGVPRTDIFFNQYEINETLKNVYEELPYLKDKKVILFAPTFRGNGQQSAYYPFEWLDYTNLYNELKDSNYVFLFKIHPFVKSSPNIPYEFSDFFYDVSEYREVNNLLLATDILITDYSSIVFEYSLLKRKTIFFAPDLVDYMNNRNFYVDYLQFIPGPFVDNMNDLIQQIRNENIDIKRMELFLNYYFDDLDGKASERFVNLLERGFEDDELEKSNINKGGKFIPKWGERK